MAMEETNLTQSLRDYAKDLGYIHLADNNRRLPGQGMTDFTAIATTLREAGYDGWVSLECGQPGRNAEQARHFIDALPATMDMLRKLGMM
jgi:sugar phosphate isomerase/epimerase